MTPSLPAFSLGVGQAEAKSFIGQQLLVRIPIFNVSAPNSLQIEFDSEQFGGNGQANVTTELERTNSQLAITLSSDKVVNEPYLNFSLSFADAGTQFSKNFTVLLNLPSNIRNTSSSSSVEIVENQSPNSVKGGSSIVDLSQSGVNRTTPGRVMGPYETAVPGNIPERFGAVLDGQSLWRVARRLNSAMGVTRAQMMWALYKANPGSFSNERIESLKAGSYLNIPSIPIVTSTSDSEAKKKLRALNKSKLLQNSESNIGLISSAESSAPVSDDLSNVTSSTIDPGPFQVTAISQSANGESPSEQVQMTVASLTETVGNMSQRLEKKDREIEFLEAQVEELKSFISAEKLAESEPKPLIAQEPISRSVITPELRSMTNSEPQSQEKKAWWKSLLPWLLFALITLCVVTFSAWARIQNFFYKLNLFGRQDDMEFSIAEPKFDSVSDVRPDEFGLSNEVVEPYRAQNTTENRLHDVDDSFSVYDNNTLSEEHGFNEEPSINFDGAYEESESTIDAGELRVPHSDGANTIDAALSDDANAVGENIRVVKHDLPEGVLAGNYDESEMVETIEFLADEITARNNDEGLTFEQRFDSLLKEKDFDFARELLDFARYNEINDDRYHFERLRMLEAMGDSDAFYEYYYSIEEEISDFPQQIQTQISQLVVQLALP